MLRSQGAHSRETYFSLCNCFQPGVPSLALPNCVGPYHEDALLKLFACVSYSRMPILHG